MRLSDGTAIITLNSIKTQKLAKVIKNEMFEKRKMESVKFFKMKNVKNVMN